MDSLQAEKAQEHYYASMAAAAAQQQSGPSSYDTSYGTAAASSAYGDPNLWAYDSNWVPEEWDDGGNHGGQQY
jgi:hypothetical protein